MSRKKYVLKVDEIETLVEGVLKNGADDTYNRMHEKALSSYDRVKDLDEMFLDMSEDFLERARMEVKEENKAIQDAYYLLSSMLKKLAYDINRMMRKAGKERNGERFFKAIVNLEAAPTYPIKRGK